jgi:hypothetical protein
MSGYVFALALTVVVLVMLFLLMRRRRMREKYAAVWIALALAVVVLGAFPRLAVWLASLAGVETPVNLVFALAFVVLLLVCIQLSVEVSNLEEETRTIAEELSLLRFEVEHHIEATGSTREAPSNVDPT